MNQINRNSPQFSRHFALSVAILLLLVIGSCAAVFFSGCTTAPSQATSQQTIAKAEVSVGAGYNLLSELYMGGKVNKPDALNYRARLVDAENLLKQAEIAARSNDPVTSDTAQAAAVAIINEVTQALAARKAAK
jgi:hypothetical protein